MPVDHRDSPFTTAWVVVTEGIDPTTAITAAGALAQAVVLVGYVRVPDPEQLSEAAVKARAVRRQLRALSTRHGVRARTRVLVTQRPWAELAALLPAARPELLVLDWESDFAGLGVDPRELLDRPPCNVVIVRGKVGASPGRVLVPVRGGPYAELALRVGMALRPGRLAVLQVRRTPFEVDAPVVGIERLLARMEGIERAIEVTDDPLSSIDEAARDADVVVLGATADTAPDRPALGSVAMRLLEGHAGPVMIVRSQRSMMAERPAAIAGSHAISILVDRWFAENTYEGDEFDDLDALLRLKHQQGRSISLALPALNEEATVGTVIQCIKRALMDDVPLLDEIVLIDSNSTDRTREIAQDLGVSVHIHQDLLPRLGPRTGKGEALWKSLYVTKGDIVAWIDTDIVNIHPRFVYGIIGPLLADPRLLLVKGFYRRPLRVDGRLQAGGGGRVTELMARPLLNLFYPELSGLIQPLSGEYAGRRQALEQLPFFSGYGVEIGLLIDILERFGLDRLAQVNLRERVHHNQPLEALSKMAFVIAQAVLRKLESRFGQPLIDEVDLAMKSVAFAGGRYRLQVNDAFEQERPPMLELPEYRDRRPHGRSA